jgi:outer membrane protein TolC
MKKLFAYTALICLLAQPMYAQDERSEDQEPDPYSEVIDLNVDFATFKLPPLSVLYANAMSNPSIKIKEKEKRLQQLLLRKEKRQWLSFFNARAGYTRGVTDNYGTMTDPLTPIYTQYTGVEQTYWNVGGNVNISLETLFDLGGSVKRQRIKVETAELEKQVEYDELKQKIAALYVNILSNIETLKKSSEHLALYHGVSSTLEQDYRNRRASLNELAEAKKSEFEANQSYENLRNSINEGLLVLEIISHTPILTRDLLSTDITED